MTSFKKFTVILIVILAGISVLYLALKSNTKTMVKDNKKDDTLVINLPQPRFKSEISIEEALLKRRSVRHYRQEPLTIAEVSQLLWAGQGVTDERGFRTAPSAGATYPLETYLVVNNVIELKKGIYKYSPDEHILTRIVDGDRSDELCIAALTQSSVSTAAINIVFSAIYKRTTKRYGERGEKYVHMEVGHAAENICLQAISLKCGTVVIGAFIDEAVKKICKMPDEEKPLYIISIGKKN